MLNVDFLCAGSKVSCKFEVGTGIQNNTFIGCQNVLEIKSNSLGRLNILVTAEEIKTQSKTEGFLTVSYIFFTENTALVNWWCSCQR